jgi:molecular chaperone GrpE
MIEDRDAVPGDGAGNGANEAPGSDLPMEEPGVSSEVEDAASASGPGGATEASAAGDAVDYKDRWLRTEADLQNFRRRAARDREEAVSRAQEAVLLDAIGVLDDLERALAVLTPEQAAEPWTQGVALTAQRMRDLLGRYGVREIEAVGRPFDPAVHDALLEIDPPEGVTPGTVAQVIMKGYRRVERALRAARVVVAKSLAKD